MELDIENFGSINEAHIKLRKINIIAGVNGSGKSTSSKLLSCFLTANSKDGHYLSNNSIYERFVSFILYWHNKISSNQSDNVNLDGMLTLIGDNINLHDNTFNAVLTKKFKILKEMVNQLQFTDKDKFEEDLSNIEKLIEVNDNENHRYFNVSNVLLNSEFNFSELTGYKEAHVHFHGTINDCNFTHEIDFKGDKIGAKLNERYVDCLNIEDVIYIDSPSIFDLSNMRNNYISSKIPYHLSHLTELISSERNSTDVFDEEFNHKIIDFQEKFNKLINGSIYYDSKNNDFIFIEDGNKYSMKNTASGIKQIGIIQLLLENRHLKENCFLFIDEPEVNLHPEWQVKLAELLIMLVKELNIYLYINSHSPQFIEALEVFAEKYNLIDESSFYLSKKSENNKFTFEEITYDTLNLLYDNLGDPYDIIDKIRAENIYNKIG